MDPIEKALSKISGQRPGTRTTAQPAEIERVDYSQTRTISVSDEALRKNRVITSETEDYVLQAYKVLRTRILKRMQQNGWQTIAVTSPRQSEGKTLTAINLGLSIAMKTDNTVLLVDLDFRRPSLHHRLSIKTEYGVTDYLTNDIPIQRALVNPGIERLVVFPQAHRAEGGSELLSSQSMKDMVTELKNRYQSRIIIFDMPPAFVGDEVLTFSFLTDTTLLVVEDGKTLQEDIHQVYQHLEGSNIIGTVLNKSADAEDSYEYGYY